MSSKYRHIPSLKRLARRAMEHRECEVISLQALTDGALRMRVVLHFHNLGYSPLEVASLFLLYEFFGVVTNLFGGWLAGTVLSGWVYQSHGLKACLIIATLFIATLFIATTSVISVWLPAQDSDLHPDHL